jgi:ABC-type nitrate/sulfonate/bicarbonate transport system substrate-binding protein
LEVNIGVKRCLIMVNKPYDNNSVAVNRRVVPIGVALLSMTALFLFFLVQHNAEELPVPLKKLPLTIGASKGDPAALVWIAQEKGFFGENGLNVTVKGFNAGKFAAKALEDDEVEV